MFTVIGISTTRNIHDIELIAECLHRHTLQCIHRYCIPLGQIKFDGVIANNNIIIVYLDTPFNSDRTLAFHKLPYKLIHWLAPPTTPSAWFNT